MLSTPLAVPARSQSTGLDRLVVRADPATSWLVGGHLAREELVRIAAGLAVGDGQSSVRTARQEATGEP